jgi:hypothetical protein
LQGFLFSLWNHNKKDFASFKGKNIDMNDQIASFKLESFFHQKKLTKKATLGNFSDIITEEDLKATSEMVHKMVTLPKYAAIKRKLQAANGLVNFVTYDEFEPLIENIIRMAIPPSGNDVYHMGTGFSLPEDYFVDAKGLFGEQSPQLVSNALQRMEGLLRGSPKKMTREWLKANGLDPDGSAFASVFGDMAGEIRNALKTYQESITELETSDLKIDLDKTFKALDDDRTNREKLKEIEKANLTRPPDKQIALPKILSKSQLADLRKQLRTKRGYYVRALANINNSEAAQLLTIDRDMFSKEYEERGTDGFLTWSPDDEIRMVYSDILENGGDVDEAAMAVKLNNLQIKLENYRTTDPDLIEKRNSIQKFLNGPDPVQNYWSNTATFTRLMNAFVSRASQHGKVMILKNVDSSALTTAPQATTNTQESKIPTGVTLNNLGVLSDFVAANNANMIRDLQGGKRQSRGKRAIILISTYPLHGMPKGSTTIEMDASPVDETEAKIIVDSLADAYVNEAKAAATLKMAYDIEKKYKDAKTQEEVDQKDIEIASIEKNVIAAKTQLAYLSPEGRRIIEQMITGMGQKTAITRVRQLLASNIKTEVDADGMISSMSYDEADLIRGMLEEFTAEKAKAVPGLHLRLSKVKFDNYITKQGSMWGDKVGVIAAQAKECELLNQEIEMYRKAIIQIDAELMEEQFSPQSKNDKLKLRQQYEQLINAKMLQREGLLKLIPHFIVLRGKPGVGKSVFGDALADLLKCPVYDVRIQEVFDKWVGNTEKNSKLLLDAVFNSRNAVYLLDEIDRVLSMEGQDSSGSGSGGSEHPTEKKVVADFLARFGEDINQLIARNVYVIMTTNHIRSVDNALLKRTKGDVYDVEASDNPADYLRFLETFIQTERKDNPDAPWMIYQGNTTSEMWDFTEKYIREEIDLPRIAQAFAMRQLSFRSLSGLVKNACILHNSYHFEFTNAVARGEPVEPKGMPMTTANMLAAAELVNDDAVDSAQVSIGINEVYSARIREAKEMWPKIKLQEYSAPDPITGKPTKKFKVPEEYIKIVSGTEPQQAPQFEVVDEEVAHPTDPNAPKKRQTVLQPHKPDIKDLADKGMEEDTALGPEQEKIDQGTVGQKEQKKKDPKGKVTSSTEYLYRYLVDKGVINNEGVVTSQKKNVEKAVKTENVPPVPQGFDSLEQFGTYYFNNGQIMMMSIDEGVPPLTFYN